MKNGITCPKCGSPSSSVKDSRVTASGTQRRRRSCLGCGFRYTTHEMMIPKGMVETLTIIKAQCGKAGRELEKLEGIVDNAINIAPEDP